MRIRDIVVVVPMESLWSYLMPASPNDVIVYLAASVGFKIAVCWVRGSQPPSSARCVGHVTAVKLYPVKSLGGIALDEAQCTQIGLKYPGLQLFDRSWMLTVADGSQRFVTARQRPPLLLVTPSVDGDRLCFDAPGMERLRVPTEPDISALVRQKTKVFGEAIPGWDCGDEAAAWFTQYLKEGHRLLYNPGIQLRPIDTKTHLYVNSTKNDDKLVFQDDGPFLLITQSSFDDLSRRLVERDVTGHVTLEHFRPTITISGQSPPFDEDHWNEVYINDVKFTVLMPCGRCMFTTIDPLKGTVRPDGEPLKTLRSFRMIRPKDDSPCFGTLLFCDRPGTIHVGDPVFILKRKQC